MKWLTLVWLHFANGGLGKYRYRNKGLFTADQNLNGQTARFTRQNNNGNRRGYECPEERDHYPYWHPTPWIDLAIYTNDATRCEYYRTESENVKGRFYCVMPESWYHHMVRTGGNGNNGFIPNTVETCDALNEEGSQMSTFVQQEIAGSQANQRAIIDLEVQRCGIASDMVYERCQGIAPFNISDTSVVGDTEECQTALDTLRANGIKPAAITDVRQLFAPIHSSFSGRIAAWYFGAHNC
jgi:hypothetical protein